MYFFIALFALFFTKDSAEDNFIFNESTLSRKAKLTLVLTSLTQR